MITCIVSGQNVLVSKEIQYEESPVGPSRVLSLWQGMIDTATRPPGALMYGEMATTSADRNHRSKVHTSCKC